MNSYPFNTSQAKGGQVSNTWYLQNNYSGGEVLNFLTANKDSDLYLTSATRIINGTITDTGAIKVIKSLETHTNTNAKNDPQQVIITEYDYFLVLYKDEIHTIRKSDYQTINKVTTQFDRSKGRAVLIENFLLVPQVDGTRQDIEISSDGRIGVNEGFKKALRNPIKDRTKVKIDIYQVRNAKVNGTARLVPYKVSTTELQEFDVSGNKIVFKYDKELPITRIYYPYQADMLTIEDMPGLKENDYYITIYMVETLTEGLWYIGNAQINFTGKTTDKSGTYYTGISLVKGEVGKTGLLNYGLMFDNFNANNGFNIMTEFQNRMVVSDGTYIYFSKVNNYNYFLNGTQNDDAFYIKMSAINNEQPKVLRLISGRGIWAVTDKGIFLIGHNQVIQGATLETRYITSDDCTNECCDINNTLYYLTSTGKIKAVQNTTGTRGYIDFASYSVDKFNDNFNYNIIDEYFIDNDKYLFARLKTLDEEAQIPVGAYLFQEANINTFRRISIENDLTSIPFFNKLAASGGKFYTRTNNNINRFLVRFNYPYVKSEKYGNLASDVAARCNVLQVKFLDQDNEAIKKVEVANEKMNRLGEKLQGIFSVYICNLQSSIAYVSTDLYVETNENDKLLQLQANEFGYSIT